MGAAPEMGGVQRAESLTEEKGGNLLVLSWGWGPWERRGWGKSRGKPGTTQRERGSLGTPNPTGQAFPFRSDGLNSAVSVLAPKAPEALIFV